MARFKKRIVARNNDGDVWPSATIKLFNEGTGVDPDGAAIVTGTPYNTGNVYLAASGGSPVSPSTLTANANGELEIYGDTAGRFDVGIQPGSSNAAAVFDREDWTVASSDLLLTFGDQTATGVKSLTDEFNVYGTTVDDSLGGIYVDGTGRVAFMAGASGSRTNGFIHTGNLVVSAFFTHDNDNVVAFDSILDSDMWGLSTLDSGTADSATSNTLTDAKVWVVNAFGNQWVTITSGTGSGQHRRIVSNTVDTLTVTPAWTVTPDGTSAYRIVVAGDQGAVRGIWRAQSGCVSSGRAGEFHAINKVGSASVYSWGLEVAVHTAVREDDRAGMVGISVVSDSSFLGLDMPFVQRANTGISIRGGAGWDRYLYCEGTNGQPDAEIDQDGNFQTVGKLTAGTFTAGSSLINARQVGASDDLLALKNTGGTSLLEVDQDGNLSLTSKLTVGSLTPGTPKLTVKQSADTRDGGLQLVQTGAGTSFAALYTNTQESAVLEARDTDGTPGGASILLASDTALDAFTLSARNGLSANLLVLAVTGTGTMATINAAGSAGFGIAPASALTVKQIADTRVGGIQSIQTGAGTSYAALYSNSQKSAVIDARNTSDNASASLTVASDTALDAFTLAARDGVTANLLVLAITGGSNKVVIRSDGNINATVAGVATFTKAGTISDADFASAPPVGTIAIDTTNNTISVRTAAATWKTAALA